MLDCDDDLSDLAFLGELVLVDVGLLLGRGAT
jgi:hypothetical protein